MADTPPYKSTLVIQLEGCRKRTEILQETIASLEAAIAFYVQTVASLNEQLSSAIREPILHRTALAECRQKYITLTREVEQALGNIVVVRSAGDPKTYLALGAADNAEAIGLVTTFLGDGAGYGVSGTAVRNGRVITITPAS